MAGLGRPNYICGVCKSQWTEPPKVEDETTWTPVMLQMVSDTMPLDTPSQVILDGAGTELSAILNAFGIEPDSCACKRHMHEMNSKGTQWCRENMGTIVQWLKEEAERRKLLFSKHLAKTLVRIAIRRAERKKRK